MANYTLGNLIWRIRGENADFDKSLTSSENRITKFADKTKKAGQSLTKFLTLPLAAAGVASVKAASDLEESLNAVNVVFGDSAKTINRFGEVSAESAGLSQSAFNGLATVIGAQLKQSGQDLDTVADNTVELTGRAADLASVFNTDVKDATNALGSALRGETEPARRFGINISQAAIESEALASGLVESKDQIDEQIKVQARYNLILKQSSDVAGDFANTSDSLANQTRILKSDLTDVAAELGENLLPLATDLIGAASDLVGWFGDLDEGAKSNVVAFGGLAAAVGPVLIGISSITKAIRVLNTSILFGPLGLIAAAVAGGVALGALADEQDRARQSTSAVSEGFSDLQQMARDANEEVQTGIDAAETSASRYDALAKSLRQATIAGKRWEAVAAQFNDTLSDSVEDEETFIEQLRAQGDEIDSLNGLVFTEIEGLERKIELRGEELERLQDVAVKNGEVTEEQAGAIAFLRGKLEEYYERLEVLNEENVENEIESTAIISQDQRDALNQRIFERKAWEVEKESLRRKEEQEEARLLDKRKQKYADVAESYVLNFTSAFADVGAALVNQEDAWAAVGQAALGTIAEVVRALGQQLAAQAALLYAEAFFTAGGTIPSAVAATVGSAAAFAAAGAIEASAQNFQTGGFVQPRPGVSDTGDRVPARLNPREVVLTESDANELLGAIRGGGLGGITVQVNTALNTDSEKNMERAARALYPYLDREGARRG